MDFLVLVLVHLMGTVRNNSLYEGSWFCCVEQSKVAEEQQTAH